MPIYSGSPQFIANNARNNYDIFLRALMGDRIIRKKKVGVEKSINEEVIPE